jgi:hypothetical protein
MPALVIDVGELRRFGKKWKANSGALSRSPPYSSGQLGNLFDAAVGEALAQMLGGIPIVSPSSTALVASEKDCVEVGPVRIIGGVRPQNFDVGYCRSSATYRCAKSAYEMSRPSSPTRESRPSRTGRARTASARSASPDRPCRNHVNYLHAIFAFAQRREEVDVNPVTAAAKPKSSKASSEFSFLTPAQVDAAIHAVVDDYLRQTGRTIILTAAMTGLQAS